MYLLRTNDPVVIKLTLINHTRSLIAYYETSLSLQSISHTSTLYRSSPILFHVPPMWFCLCTIPCDKNHTRIWYSRRRLQRTRSRTTNIPSRFKSWIVCMKECTSTIFYGILCAIVNIGEALRWNSQRKRRAVRRALSVVDLEKWNCASFWRGIEICRTMNSSWIMNSM